EHFTVAVLLTPDRQDVQFTLLWLSVVPLPHGVGVFFDTLGVPQLVSSVIQLSENNDKAVMCAGETLGCRSYFTQLKPLTLGIHTCQQTDVVDHDEVVTERGN